MSYDNSPLLVERNEAGFWSRAEMLDQAKSVLGLSYVLAEGVPRFTYTGGTSSQVMAQATIPAGLLSAPGSSFRITPLWSGPAALANRNTGCKVGATFYTTGSYMSTANLTARMVQEFWVNAAGAVVGHPGALGVAGTATALPADNAVDMTTDQVVQIIGQLGNAADSITLEAWRIEVFLT